MRRFLLSFIFIGVLSAVFSFTAFAENCYTDYLGTSQTTYSNRVTYNVNASAGDQWFFDVSVNSLGDQIYNGNSVNVTSTIYNRAFDFTYAITAVGCNYGAATCSVEGSRIWIFFDRDVSSGSVTITYEVTVTYSWTRGVVASGSSTVLSDCIATRNFNVSHSSFKRNGSGFATEQSNSKKLDEVLEILRSDPSPEGFLGPDAILYFSSPYFDQCYNGAFIQPNEEGYFQTNGSTQSGVSFLRNNNTVDVTLQPGDYLFSYSLYAQSSPDPSNIKVHGIKLSDVVVDQDWQYTNLYRIVGILHLDSILSAREFVVDVGVLYSSGVFYGGIVPLSSDFLAGSSINPDQDKMVSDVDDAGEQQSQQEDQMWHNINTYKGDISFNLDGWDDAAGGLSYITGVFMTVWNNSPTQPIVLSLMLGIAMLSIGRGVMAAVRVSRNRGGD